MQRRWQLTLPEATEYVLATYPSKNGDPSYKCQTGEPYVSMCSGGIRPEGERWPALYPTAEAAVKAWVQSVQDYCKGRPGAFYWREYPSMIHAEMVDVTHLFHSDWPRDERNLPLGCVLDVYSVYSRFVISDGPEISPSNNVGVGTGQPRRDGKPRKKAELRNVRA